MIIHQAFQYKLIPSVAQAKEFSSWLGTCRFLFNCALEQRTLAYKDRKISLSYEDQANELKAIKKVPELEWFKNPPAQILQQTLKDLNSAFQNFFKNKNSYPKFKKKSDGGGFRFPTPTQFSIRVVNKNKALLDLPKIGEVKFHYSRPIEGEIKNATISKINNEWFVSFCCEKEIEVKKNEQSAIGIDLGVKRTIAISEENIYSDSDCNLPEKIKTIEKMIARSQRKLSKRKKFGKNWFKLKKKN